MDFNFNASVVIWRECLEAILIVGIFFSLLAQRPSFERTKKYLNAGILAGVGLSCLIAYFIQHAYSELQGLALDYFEISLLVIASLMMTHMCLWMKHNSKKMVREAREKFESALSSSRLVGISVLTAIAIAREGSEIAIFLYSFVTQTATTGQASGLALSAGVGFALAALTGYLYFVGLKKFDLKWFFRITSIFLLMTASTMLIEAVRRVMQMDLITFGVDPVWDTSWLVSDGHWFGRFLSTLVGYESQPALIVLLTAAAFWVISLSLYLKPTEAK